MSNFYLIKSKIKIGEKQNNKLLSNIKYKDKGFKEKYFFFKSRKFTYNLGLVSKEDSKNFIYKFKHFVIFFNGIIYSKNQTTINNIPKKILTNYLQTGKKFIQKLNGNFAFIIIDLKKDSVKCFRDRYGTNLLFYNKKKNFLSIFSKIRIFKNSELIKLKPNLQLVKLFLAKNYRYSYGLDSSFFEGIKIFNPNSINIFNKNNLLKTSDLIKFNILKNNHSISSAKKKLIFLIKKSLSLRYLPVKNKSAFFLSGGIDSPTVATLAKKISKNIKTYSISYKDYKKNKSPKRELSYDESYLIKDIVKFNSFKSNYIFPNSKSFKKTFQEMLEIHDEPISSPTWYSHFIACKKLNRDKVKFIFGGDGGDHILAGLYDDIPYFFADLKAEKKKLLLKKELELWIKYHDHPVFKKSKKLFNYYCKICFDFKRKGMINNYTWDENIFRKTFSENILKKNISVPKNYKFPSSTKSFLKSKMIQDLLYTSSPPSSRAEIPNFSYFGLQCRSVLLDNDLVNFCWGLPGDYLIRNGYTKWILREALSHYLPKNVLWNKNHIGLNAPANIWFRGKLKKHLIDNIKTLIQRKKINFINKKKVEKILSDHFSKKKDHMMLLWKLFSVENWLKNWDKNEKNSTL